MAEIGLGRLSPENATGSTANPDEDELFDIDDDVADEALEKEALENFQERLHGEDYRAVVFVDLLGFSDLTLKWPVIEDEFRVLDRPNKIDFLGVRLESVGNNRLIEAYMHFTMALDEVIEYQLLCDNPIRSITFSDSAFIATEHVEDAISIANEIWSRGYPSSMRCCLPARS